MTAKKKQLIDISMNIQPRMPIWPGDPEVVLSPCSRIAAGDKCNMTAISMGLHTGTHVDAPFHFLEKGRTIDTVPLEDLVGPARVIAIKDTKQITVEELKQHRIKKNEVLLFKTGNSMWMQRARLFRKKFVYIPEETACYLAGKKVKTIGVDYLSVGGYKKDGRKVHQHLLTAGIWLIEGLNLLNRGSRPLPPDLLAAENCRSGRCAGPCFFNHEQVILMTTKIKLDFGRILSFIIIVALTFLLYFYGLVMPQSRRLQKIREMPIKDIPLAQVDDGKYRGSYTQGDFTYIVDVIVEGHHIQGLRAVQSPKDNVYARKAEAVFAQVLIQQTPNVDVMTGATISSKALLKAVENALTGEQYQIE